MKFLIQQQVSPTFWATIAWSDFSFDAYDIVAAMEKGYPDTKFRVTEEES